jgi:putative DNA primase/helicase
MTNAATWADRYIERFGLALVPLPHASKAPVNPGWNLDENLIRTIAQVRNHWRGHPYDGLGVCLEPSGLVSLDADYFDGTRMVLAAEGIDIDELIAKTPTIVGRAPRLEFMAPPGVVLGRKNLLWPAGEGHPDPVTVLELRAGRVQDVLPPSIHPKTQAPYRWETAPRIGFPPLPDQLLRLWQDFDAFKQRARNLCPWAEPEAPPAATAAPRRSARSARTARNATGPSVIQAFNSAHDPTAILEAHGYKRAGAKRWMSPFGKNLAGVVLLPSGKIFCHHTDDQLGDGRAHDAFDLFARLDHGGDVRAAVKAAAQALGMADRRSVVAGERL